MTGLDITVFDAEETQQTHNLPLSSATSTNTHSSIESSAKPTPNHPTPYTDLKHPQVKQDSKPHPISNDPAKYRVTGENENEKGLTWSLVQKRGELGPSNAMRLGANMQEGEVSGLWKKFQTDGNTPDWGIHKSRIPAVRRNSNDVRLEGKGEQLTWDVLVAAGVTLGC